MKFTASNGAEITSADYGTFKTLLSKTVDNSVALAGVHVDALREFFQHERDEELSRWRWPENPDYVVYKDGTSRRVIRESSGSFMQVSLHDRKVMTTYLDSYVGAARAYDEAHPERKPWHSASFGEVWVLTVDGEEIPCTVNPSPDFIPVSHKRWATIARGSQRIETARRIYPEPS